MEEPKFKYIISPDNTYLLAYPDLDCHLQLKGSDILAYFRREAALQQAMAENTKEE